jgi:hypothetical protein
MSTACYALVDCLESFFMFFRQLADFRAVVTPNSRRRQGTVEEGPFAREF